MLRVSKWLAALWRPLPACDCPTCRARRAEVLAELARASGRGVS